MRTTLLSMLLLGLLAGCSHRGENDYLGFDFPQLSDTLNDFRSGDQLLLGTRLCPEITEHRAAESFVYLVDAERDELRACFDEAVDGPATLDADGCLAFTDVGEVSWELTPNSCGEQSERMRFTLVEPSPDLQLGIDEWRLRILQEPAFEAELIGLAPGRDMTELSEPSSEPRRVFEGQLDVPIMRFDNANGRVYWMASDVELELVGAGLELADDEDDGTLEMLAGNAALPLRMSPGSSGHVRASLAGGEVYESPELIAVSLDTVASLDLVAADSYLFVDVRDAEGHLLHAAPIEWSVDEGALAIEPGTLTNGLLTPEYASFWHGNCEAPPTTGSELRHAIVRARLGELEDTIELEYMVEAEPGLTLGPDSDCLYAEAPADEVTEIGCACTIHERAPAAPLLVSVGGLLALLRRRRAASTRA
jgi:hypothetical protein